LNILQDINFLSSLLNLKRINRNRYRKKGFALGSLTKGFKCTIDRSSIHYSYESMTLQKTPRVLLNRTCDPFPNGTVTAAEEKGGVAYRRRGCSSEGLGEVRGSLAITSRCGSSAVVVGVGRSTCAGGGARRRRGIRPNQGGTVQLNGSRSFTRGQGRHVREEFENGSPDCLVYARLWATEVRRGRSSVSGEALPGPRT
jgi:hypothetical protein